MKNTKNLAKRSLAILLVLVLCLGLSPLTVLADEDAAAETPTESTQTPATENKSAEDANTYIPDDAKTENSTTTDGNTTTNTETKTWGPDNEGKSPETPDVPTEGGTSYDSDVKDENGDDVDLTDEEIDQAIEDLGKGKTEGIDDGTYSKTEKEDSTTTTETEKSGSQTKNDSVTNNQDGSTTFTGDVEGHEDTKTTETTTGSETTTDVTKETVTDEEGLKDVEDELDDVDVTLGEDDVDENYEAADKELTVSGGSEESKKDETKGKITAQAKESVKNTILEALEGWTILDSDGKVVGTVTLDDDGKYVVKDDEGHVKDFELTFDDDGNCIVNATKVKTVDNDNAEAASSVVKQLEADDDYVRTDNGDGTTTYTKTETLPDGSTVITKYTISVDEPTGKIIITQSATVTAALVDGEYTVSAEWGDLLDNSEDLEIAGLEPDGDVLKIALQNRTRSSSEAVNNHIISVGWPTLAKYFGIQQLVDPNGKDEYKNWTEDYKNLRKMSAEDLYAKLCETASKNAANGMYLDGLILQSSVGIKDASGKISYAWLRRMADGKGGYIYVYCAEHGKTDVTGTDYDFVNVGDHAVYSGNAAHIQYVVENGWWGTSGGTGSLDAVKDFLRAKSSLSEDEIGKLDHGIAMAATQAAIWYYASSTNSEGNPNTISATDVFTEAWSNVNGDTTTFTGTEQKVAQALFTALIAKDQDVSGQVNAVTDLIHAKDVKSASLKINEKVSVDSIEKLNDLVKAAQDETAPVKDKNGATDFGTSDDLYMTNVSVTLGVVPSRINADIIVYVYCDDVAVGSKRVTKAELNAADGEEYKITIEDVVLKNGANITFNVTGTQTLTEGAYLFSAVDKDNKTTSQTMVGYVGVGNTTATHNVNLNVDMTFTVNKTKDAKAQGKVDVEADEAVYVTTTVTDARYEQTTVTTGTVYWKDSYEYTKPGETPGEDPDIPDEDVPLVPGDDDDIDIDEEDVPLAGAPAEPEEEEFEIFEEEVPLAPAAPEFVILDEDVPLAAVPMTGDASAVWFYITILSAAGLLCLLALENKKSKEN